MYKMMHPNCSSCVKFNLFLNSARYLIILLIMSVTSCDLFSPGLGDAVDTGYCPLSVLRAMGTETYVGGDNYPVRLRHR